MQRPVPRHLRYAGAQNRRPVPDLPAQAGQQDLAIFRLPDVLRQAGPCRSLLLQPAVRIGVALHFSIEVQRQLLQPTVVPAEAEAVRQLDLTRGHVRIERLQHPGQHPAAQQLRLALVQYPEVGGQPLSFPQVQQVDVLPQQGGTEGVDGLDVRLINQQQLPLQMAVTGALGHALAQLVGDALPQLGGGGAGIGDDKEVVHAGLLLPQHPAEQAVHQHPGLAAACGGGNQYAPAGIIHHSLLAFGQLYGHFPTPFRMASSTWPQNSSGVTGQIISIWSPPSPSAKWQAEANSQ